MFRNLVNRILLTGSLLLAQSVFAQHTALPIQNDRWAIQPNGSITWQIKDRLPHTDHIEMSGEKVSLWVQYTIDADGACSINRTVVFPTFRTLPDHTRSHISYNFPDNLLPHIYVDERWVNINGIKTGKTGEIGLVVKNINQKGIMRVNAQGGDLVKVERSVFPSVDKPIAIEKFVVTNISSKPQHIFMEHARHEVSTDTATSKGHVHTMLMETVLNGSRTVQPGQSTTFAISYRATDAPAAPIHINVNTEERARQNRIDEILAPLQLETPDKTLNTEFAFAKIRATESIFKTKHGYIHSPGGLSYYAAIWANDQAEYISPFFGFLGDKIGNLSAMNCYDWFASHMNPEYKPLPSSIVAEGDAFWNGAGDRGDQAMIAYGASRYALTFANVDSAKKLWPLITWCLEYSHRHINKEGVVESNSDELEGRFPSGKANLSTNCLYYDALNSAVYLGEALHQPKNVTDAYYKQANKLCADIEKYFGAKVEGFDTYRYYETNDVLRAWICLPLTVGIFDRSKGTVDALFSPRLWTADGLATQAGKPTFWDRSTLYALRGVFQANGTERAINFLKYYSRRRLLGEHVPYPVEAYPEGNQRHLSAESGLYCRIYIEGMFGIRPTGFNTFNCAPRLPKEWDKMALRNIHSFGHVFDVEVRRKGHGQLVVEITEGGKVKRYQVKDGGSVVIKV